MAGMDQSVTVTRSSPAGAFPSSGLQGIAVVIPAWQPESRLQALVASLAGRGIRDMVVVDDGSGPQYAAFFRELARVPGVIVLEHQHNQGKGRALKTGFAHVLRAMPHVHAVVSADADGQHLPEDIVQVARTMLREPGEVVLGTRCFAGPAVPLRSRLGNQITRVFFAVAAGRLLGDTQTGLRGLPRTLLANLLTLPGERYEFEMVMLAYLCALPLTLVEVPIRTVYLDGNRGSHFRPLQDSVLVYRALWRFRGSAGAARRRRGRAATTAKPRLHAA